MKDRIIYFLFLLFIGWRITSSHDVYSTMANTKQYLTAESELINVVKNYVSSQEEKLQLLKSQLSEMEKVHSEAANFPDFLANPINTFLLIKRLTKTSENIKYLLSIDRQEQELELMATLSSIEEMLQYPERKALTSIVRVLRSLQEIYQLEIPQLAKGIIQGMKPAYSELSGKDCADIGMQSYNDKEYPKAVLWMKEALARYENEDTDDLVILLDHLSYSLYETGDLDSALAFTNQLLSIQPDHEGATGNKAALERLIDERNENLIEDFVSQTIDESTAESEDNEEEKENGEGEEEEEEATEFNNDEAIANYTRLCRGESMLHPTITRKLFCYYQNSTAFLRLAPIKAEILHLNPTVTLYHDVIYETEIEAMKEYALSKLEKAMVLNVTTGESISSSTRLSSLAWLYNDEPFLKNVNSRIEDITGLSLNTSEAYQVVHYGIFGHYQPHWDYLDYLEDNNDGNRIATFLYYINDVEAGGSTVFPLLGIGVKPQKGTAVFWYNLHFNGEQDKLTLHAACPVLVGEKWVSNKWIRERGQEFRRPCLLSSTD